MKKLIFCFLFWAIALIVSSQTVVNSNGSLKMRGNVAIMVTGNSYTFDNRNFHKKVDDETLDFLKTTINTLAIDVFQNMCFGVVNRDDEAFAKVKSLIEENRLEDYLDGFSVQAKNQGADYLFIADVSLYSEGNRTIQFLLSTRLLDVSNNLGYHYSFKSDAYSLNSNEKDLRGAAQDLAHQVYLFLRHELLCIFPEQYFIAKAEKKKLWLGAYQPTGGIAETDKFYGFKYQKLLMNLNKTTVNLQSIEKVCEASNPSSDGGYLVLKSDKQVTPSNDIVLFRETEQPNMPATMTMTYFGFNCPNNSYEGMIKSRVNSAFYEAITRHPGLALIEHDHLAELKKERELQKSEDFIDGHVVDQMKAIGAQYLLHVDNFNMNGALVSFKLSMISVAENRILRTIDISSSIDNIENEIYKQLCERLRVPCVVKSFGNDKLDIISAWGLHEGTVCILRATKSIINPATNEISYQVADICELEVIEYKGNLATMKVKKVTSKEDYQQLEKYSQESALTIGINGSVIKSNYDANSSVEKVSKKSRN